MNPSMLTRTIASNGDSVTVEVVQYANLMIQIGGTFAGFNGSFEGSLDGTNWFTVQAIRTNGGAVESTTGVLSAAPAYAWELSVNGLNYFRLRSTALTSGTVSVLLQRTVQATEPTTAGSGGSTSGTSTGASTSATLQNAATATGNGTAIDTTGLGAMNVTVTGTFVATVTFEYKDSSGNWQTALVQPLGSVDLVSTTSAPGVYRVPIGAFNGFRARISAYTSGSVTVTAFAENTSYVPAVQNIGLYNKLDPVNDGVTTYPFGHAPVNITTNTTTTVKTGAGVLKSIKVNNPALITVASLTITVYDNTAASGQKIGTLTVPIDTTAKPFSINYDSGFTTGLTIVTAGPTVPGDITVEYR